MLAAKVETKTGKKVKIFVKVDKAILGGGIIKIGDFGISKSIARCDSIRLSSTANDRNIANTGRT